MSENPPGVSGSEPQIVGYGHAEGPFCSEDVHGWFELTYSSYLVLHRTLLQEMPGAWQHAFVELLEELRDAFPGAPGGSFMVKLRDPDYSGRFVSDPLANYRYPDQRALEEARTERRPGWAERRPRVRRKAE